MSLPPAHAPPIASCDGCGACCAIQGAPPDYVALRLHPEFATDPTFAEDAIRLGQLPAEARAPLDDYLRRSQAGEIPRDGPCAWYDSHTTRCVHYDWRPSTCRVFERDSPGCHIYRRLLGVQQP